MKDHATTEPTTPQEATKALRTQVRANRAALHHYRRTHTPLEYEQLRADIEEQEERCYQYLELYGPSGYLDDLLPQLREARATGAAMNKTHERAWARQRTRTTIICITLATIVAVTAYILITR